MTRALGFQGNGRITTGHCHVCGGSVQVRHGSYPGENWPRHLFWCDTCNGYSILYPLDDYCQECRHEATGETVYLLAIGHCPYINLTTSYTVAEIQAAEAQRKRKVGETAVQIRMKL